MRVIQPDTCRSVVVTDADELLLLLLYDGLVGEFHFTHKSFLLEFTEGGQ